MTSCEMLCWRTSNEWLSIHSKRQRRDQLLKDFGGTRRACCEAGPISAAGVQYFEAVEVAACGSATSRSRCAVCGHARALLSLMMRTRWMRLPSGLLRRGDCVRWMELSSLSTSPQRRRPASLLPRRHRVEFQVVAERTVMRWIRGC